MIRSIFLILFSLALLAACSEKTSQETKYYIGSRAEGGDILYQLDFDGESIEGNALYIDENSGEIDSLSIQGKRIRDAEIEWYSFLDGSKQFYCTGIFGPKGELKIARHFANHFAEIDSVFLKELHFKVYDKKVREAYALVPLPMKDLKRDTVIGDYLFEILVENWNPETYLGETTFIIKDKTSKETIQTIQSDRFWFNKQLAFSFDNDFNFDQINDLRFYNGLNGSYMTQTFDYYLFNQKAREFIYSDQLATISGGVGIEFDSEKKRIISHNKSGCCTHWREAYIAEGDSFKLVKSLLVDEFDNSVVIKNKTNDKWHITEKPFKSYSSEAIDKLYVNF